MKVFEPIWAWVFLGLALAVSLFVDINNTSMGGSIDFRNRITGARLFSDQIGPYHYKWHKGEPEEYCDLYNNPNPAVPMNRVTATPAALMLFAPLSTLPYRIAQFIWLFAQWGLLLGTAGLWLLRCDKPWQSLGVGILTVGFTYTAAWRLHAERGQAYVLLLFVFACWLLLTLDPKKGNGFFTGAVAGFLVALRPPFLLLAPFMILHRRGQLLGAAVGLLLAAGLPMLVNPGSWADYFSAMHDTAVLYTADLTPPFTPQPYPSTVEGIPIDTLAYFAPIPYADFSVYVIFHAWGIKSFPNLPVLLAVVVPFGIWLWQLRGQAVERLLPGLAAWLFIVDLFLPAYRNNYNDIMILNVVAAGLVAASRIPWGVWPCLVALPMGWAVYGLTLGKAWAIDLPSDLYTLSAIFFILWSTLSPRQRGKKVHGAAR